MQVLTARTGGDGAGRGLQLEVRHTPASPRPPDTVPGFLKLTEGATLNLSCEVAGPDPAAAAEVSLSWYLPNHAAIDKQRLEQRGGEAGVGRSSLVIAPLMEADTGDYECWAQAPATSTQVKKILKVRTALCLTIEYCNYVCQVLVEPRRGNCQAGQYQCEGQAKQYCIATRYRCDSHADCPHGDDEAEMLCGPEPCKGGTQRPLLSIECSFFREDCVPRTGLPVYRPHRVLLRPTRVSGHV